MRNTRGITLIALVITIVVLIILVGITINLVLGQNGTITRAQDAATLTEEAQANEQTALSELDTEIDSLINGNSGTTYDISNVKSSGEIISTTENTQIVDDNGEIFTVPAGFKIASDSATIVNDGIVIEDADGNQYVWIPVASIDDYIRIDFRQYGSYSDYSETMPTDEQTSIETYKGYYIGRYEAGDSVSTSSGTLRASGASVTNKVSIKKGQAPYNYVTRDQAITLAEGIDTAQGYNATTKLCSSYAWDTAINFIQRTISNYGTSSPQGNYYDTIFSYTDIIGVSQTKANYSYVLIPTGQTTAVCNIYDMGGNDYEWTTEASTVSSYPCVYRGGRYSNTYSAYSAGYRTYNNTTKSVDFIAFRSTLYM